MPGNYKIIKDALFEPPAIFKLIQSNSSSSNREMYEVFNMGCRIEVYCSPEDAAEIIKVSQSFAIDAKVIGRVEEDVKKSVEIVLPAERIVY
jgi:phosphoribosylformylglycinamidine cyclo-ligase